MKHETGKALSPTEGRIEASATAARSGSGFEEQGNGEGPTTVAREGAAATRSRGPGASPLTITGPLLRSRISEESHVGSELMVAR